MAYGYVHRRPNPGQARFSFASYLVDEDAGLATVTVQRISGSKGAVTVNYATTGGSAQPGANYTDVSGTITWANGDRANKTFAIPLINSPLLQTELTVLLSLTNPTNGLQLGVPSESTLFINIDQSQYLNLLSILDRLSEAYFDTYPQVLA